MYKTIQLSGDDVIGILQKVIDKKYPGEKIDKVHMQENATEPMLDLEAYKHIEITLEVE